MNNIRRKTIDTSIINHSSLLDKENNKNQTNKRRYSIRSPANIKSKTSYINDTESLNNLSDFDISVNATTMVDKHRSITANPADLSEILEDLVDQSCLSIHSEDHLLECSNHKNLIESKSTTIINTKPALRTSAHRRKTFDGVITSTLIAKQEHSDDSYSDLCKISESCSGFHHIPDRRATVDPSDLLAMMHELDDDYFESQTIRYNKKSCINNGTNTSVDDTKSSPIHKKTKTSSPTSSVRSTTTTRSTIGNDSKNKRFSTAAILKSPYKNYQICNTSVENSTQNKSPQTLRRSPRIIQSHVKQSIESDSNSYTNKTKKQSSKVSTLRTTVDANDLQDLFDDLGTDDDNAIVFKDNHIATNLSMCSTTSAHSTENSINTLELIQNVSIILAQHSKEATTDETQISSLNDSNIDQSSYSISNTSFSSCRKSPKKQNKVIKENSDAFASTTKNDMMEELTSESKHLNVSVLNNPHSNRRETIDPSDFEAMMCDLNSSTSASISRGESIVYMEDDSNHDATTGFSRFTGRESIETVVLLQAVANTLHTLDESSSTNHFHSDNEEDDSLELIVDQDESSGKIVHRNFIVKPRRETVDQADLALLTQELIDENENIECSESKFLEEDKHLSTAAINDDNVELVDDNDDNVELVDDNDDNVELVDDNDDNATANPADVLNDTISTNNSMTTIGTLDLIDYVQASLEQNNYLEEESSDTESELTTASLVPLADILAICEKENQAIHSLVISAIADEVKEDDVNSALLDKDEKELVQPVSDKMLIRNEEKSSKDITPSSSKAANTRSRSKKTEESQLSLVPSITTSRTNKALNHSLKSCLSSKKPQRPSISSQLSISIDHDCMSTRKSVVFGSPQAAEFNKTSPTTNYTPLDKDRAKSMYSMNANIEITVENEENLDPITVENDKILEEWDRLTNASECYGSSDDDDDDDNNQTFDSPLSSANNSKKNENHSYHHSDAIMREDKDDLISFNSSKLLRRRKSMLQPILEPDIADVDDQHDMSISMIINEENESRSTYNANHLSGMNEEDSVSDITNTVNLPTNLAELIHQNDDEELYNQKKNCSSIVIPCTNNRLDESLQSCNSRTEEIEVDLQALMRNISSTCDSTIKKNSNSGFISNSDNSVLDHSDLSFVGPNYHSNLPDVSMESNQSQPGTLSSLIGDITNDVQNSNKTLLLQRVRASNIKESDNVSIQSSTTSTRSLRSSTRNKRSTSKQVEAMSLPVVDITTDDVTYNLEGSLSALVHQIAASPFIEEPIVPMKNIYTTKHDQSYQEDLHEISIINQSNDCDYTAVNTFIESDDVCANKLLETPSEVVAANNHSTTSPSTTYHLTSTLGGSTLQSSPVDTISSDTLGEYQQNTEKVSKIALSSDVPANQLISRLRLLNAGSRSNTLLQCGTPAVHGPDGKSSSRMSLGFKRMSLMNEQSAIAVGTVMKDTDRLPVIPPSLPQQSALKTARKRLSMMNSSFVQQSGMKTSKKRKLLRESINPISPTNVALDQSDIIEHQHHMNTSTVNISIIHSEDVETNKAVSAKSFVGDVVGEVVDTSISSTQDLNLSIPLSDVASEGITLLDHEEDYGEEEEMVDSDNEETFHMLCRKLSNYFSAIQSIKTVIQQYRQEVQSIVRNSLSSNLHSAYIDSVLVKIPEELLMLAWDLNPIDCELFLERVFDGLPDNFYEQPTEIITNDTMNDVEQMWINMSSVTIIAQTSVLNQRNDESLMIHNKTSSTEVSTTANNTDRFFQKVLNKSNVSMNKTMKDLHEKYQVFTSDILKTNNLTILNDGHKYVENSLELEMKLHQITLFIDIINQLTYCKIIAFQSNFIKVMVNMSSYIDISIIINFSKHNAVGSNTHVILLIDGIECDLVIANTNKNKGLKSKSTNIDKENAYVMRYFAEVMCSDESMGPLSAASLECLESPSEIPALLQKISGKISTLKLQLCNQI